MNDQVVALPAGSSSQTSVPISLIGPMTSLAVDSKGSVYVADTANNRVVKLPAE